MTEYKEGLNRVSDKMIEKIIKEGFPIKEAFLATISEVGSAHFNSYELGYIFSRGSGKASLLLYKKTKNINLDWEPNPAVQLIGRKSDKSNLLNNQMLEYAKLMLYENRDKSIVVNKLVKRFNIDLKDAKSVKFKILVITMQKI